MKILILNQDWFKVEFQALGHTVVTCGAADHLDVRVPFPLLSFKEICSLSKFEPDAVIIHDNSIPIFYTGLDSVDVPLITYSVDVQHHIRQQRFYTQFFDSVFCAQKDYLSEFVAGVEPLWLPLWAPRFVEPVVEKRHKAVFVGTMDPTLNPERVKFFDALSKKIPLECLRGEYWNIFPYSEVVLNQTVRGDLNFRAFEALMCGTTLVTEISGNGLIDLFTPGTHLATYKRGDVDHAAEVVTMLLADTSTRQAMAKQGRDEVISKHTAQSRAQSVEKTLNVKNSVGRSAFSLISNYTALGLYFGKQSDTQAMSAFNEAIRLGERGVDLGEELPLDIARDLLGVCGYVDSHTKTPRAKLLIENIQSQYPDIFQAIMSQAS